MKTFLEKLILGFRLSSSRNLEPLPSGWYYRGSYPHKIRHIKSKFWSD